MMAVMLKVIAFPVLVGIVVALGACGSSGDPDDADGTPPTPAPGAVTRPSELSLDEVYGRMEGAIERDGQVFHAHARIAAISTTYPTPVPGSEDAAEATAAAGRDLSGGGTEMWLDSRAGSGRIEERWFADPTRITRLLVRPDETFRTGENDNSVVRSLRCRGTDSPLLTRLMLCGNYLEESTTAVMDGSYGGREALVLVTEGDLPSHDWTTQFTSRLFIDRETWLPLASEQTQTTDTGTAVFEIEVTHVYENSFVSRSSLADDFFEPSAIGYVERDR
jgi:hypothetical protein